MNFQQEIPVWLSIMTLLAYAKPVIISLVDSFVDQGSATFPIKRYIFGLSPIKTAYLEPQNLFNL